MAGATAKPAKSTFATTNLSLYTVRAIILLDSDGKRILAKYFSFPAGASAAGSAPLVQVKDQKALEKQIFDKARSTKSHSSTGDVMLLDNGCLAVYKHSGDVYTIVLGAQEENELILAQVLTSLHETFQMILKGGHVDKRAMMDSLDTVLLALDECVDQGVILEVEPSVIASRVNRRTSLSATDNVSEIMSGGLTEQNLSDAWKLAKEQLAKSLLR